MSVHAESCAEIVPWSSSSAVHLRTAGRPDWNGRPTPATACGAAIAYDGAGRARWTGDFRHVTCDACRMSEPFRRARHGARPS